MLHNTESSFVLSEEELEQWRRFNPGLPLNPKQPEDEE